MDKPTEGAFCVCSAGYLGLVTSDRRKRVTYDDGTTALVWVGIHLEDRAPITRGQPWSSKDPEVVGHINDFSWRE